MMKRLFMAIAVICLALVLAACGSAAEQGTGYMQISAEDAKAVMDSGADYVLLDVRTQEEYDEGHIPGAILIPDYEITEKAESVICDKDETILVYCRSGNRSKDASAALVQLGYTDVREFGGIIDWPYDVTAAEEYNACDKPGNKKPDRE